MSEVPPQRININMNNTDVSALHQISRRLFSSEISNSNLLDSSYPLDLVLGEPTSNLFDLRLSRIYREMANFRDRVCTNRSLQNGTIHDCRSLAYNTIRYVTGLSHDIFTSLSHNQSQNNGKKILSFKFLYIKAQIIIDIFVHSLKRATRTSWLTKPSFC